jgi:hypothetical protein
MPNTFTEPTWTTPAEGDAFVSPFSIRPIAPLEIQGIIVRLLQYHFSNAVNIENPLLKAYVWNSDDLQSKILIKPGFERDSRVKGKPSLFVNREDAVGTSEGILRGVKIKTNGVTLNAPKYARHLQGKFIILCEGLTGGEAETLAWEVLGRMMLYSPVMESDFELDVFDVGGLGKPLLRAEDRETAVWAVPVIINWQKLYTWVIHNEEVY